MSWLAEGIHHRHGYEQRLQVVRELHHETTGFQDLRIVETGYFGRVLVLDGAVQTTERDEFIYHEMMVHVPMLAHGAARRVLIIGGGDGGILREVLRHPVDAAVMVEIDGRVVETCRELMPALSNGAFDDARVDLRIADGIAYVAEAEGPFDVLIVDSTDPMGPGEVLFTEAFYADCSRLLGDGGVLVTQCGVPFYQPWEVSESYGRLRARFQDVGFYTIVVPTYVGGYMTLGWASNDATLRPQPEHVLDERFTSAHLSTRHYTPAMHRSAFVLPPFIRDLVPAENV